MTLHSRSHSPNALTEAFDATLLDILFRTRAAGVALVDRDLRYLRVNDGLAAMNGRSADAHIGKTINEILPGTEGLGLEAMLRGIIDSGKPVQDMSISGMIPGSGYRHFLANYFPVRDAHGSIVGIAALVLEQTPAEKALRESEARQRRVAASGIVGIFEWSMDGGIHEANDAFLGMLGYTQDDLGNGLVDWRRMTPEEYASVDAAAVQELLDHGYHGPIAKEYIGKGGRRVPIVVTSALLEGSPDRGICVCLDDSARRAAEAEQRERNRERELSLAAERAARADAEAARRDAEAASRAKSEFLAVMSHELRTPLNAIGGYTELIELGIRGPITPQQREDLARIQKSQRHLLALINEVLNYTRLESGAVSYELEPVSVMEAITAAEMLVTPQLRAKGLRFSSSQCDPGLSVLADRDKLQQTLLNLLSNAVKFTGMRDGWPGLVEVRCNAADGGRTVHIEVHDTGCGIPADKLDTVFEPFVQVDTRLTRPHGGAGLGLAISRDLARGMGGDLTVVSTVDVGSTFTVMLPRHQL
jgi:PAS domain S-box-containing protein